MRILVGIGAFGVLLASACANVSAARGASAGTPIDESVKSANDAMGVANSACAAQLMGSIQILVGVVQSSGNFSGLDTSYIKQYWVQPPICPSLIQISYQSVDEKSAFVILSNLRTGACEALVDHLQKDASAKAKDAHRILVNGRPLTNDDKAKCLGKNISGSSLGQQNTISVYIPKSE